MRGLRVDLFAGGGGASLAIERATGESPDIAINHDAEAIAMHQANHPRTRHLLGDVWNVSPAKMCAGRPVSLLWLSPDCFPAGTLVLTSQGYRPIEEIEVGELVLTHRGRYRPVVATMTSNRPLVTVRGQGHPGLSVSPEHPIWTRAAHNVWDNKQRHYERTLGEATWTKAAELRTAGAPMNAAGGDLSFWATPCRFPALPIPLVGGRGMACDERLMWLAGRYVGDGWTRLTKSRAELVITCGKDEAAWLRERLSMWPRGGSRSAHDELAWSERETATAFQFATNHRGLVSWLRAEFGHGATTKSFPAWALGAPASMREAMLAGHVGADGHTQMVSGGPVTGCPTVSKALAFSLRSLVESLGATANVHGPYKNSSQIQGREVCANPMWKVRWRHVAQRKQNVREGDHNWTRVRSVATEGPAATVYNLSVAEDETYVVEGVVVHNCKHHSKAKGGKPRDKKIRALAWVAVRWAKEARPDVIILENVEEFANWGPLDADNKPIKSLAGHTFRRWVGDLEAVGYEVEWRELRACDYGAPTTRKRLFLVARCDGEPISWPAPTHGPGLQPFRTAAECIDWSIPCPSVFERKRPLAEKTLRRIARGIRRFVIEHADPFVIPVTHQGDDRVHSVREPLRTITGANRGELAFVSPTLIQTGYGERKGQVPRSLDLHAPLGTVVAGGQKHALVAAFMAKHYGGNESPGADLRDPTSTVTCKDHHALVAAHITKFYGTSTGQDAREPLHTITANGKVGGHFAEVRAFLTRYNGQGLGQTLQLPIGTVTTKDRFGLVTIQGTDYALTDIGMRMLQPRELYRAQGFPDSYVIDPVVRGKRLSKTAQIRMCGNSVSPPPACALVNANLRGKEQVA